MQNYQEIQVKLEEFIRKFHTNEIIRGTILFFSFGLIYFLFTLLVEYFLWLKPTFRTLLFWLFLGVEFYLLFRWILTPAFKIFGIRKGINEEQASEIIGDFFPEIEDKLLNIIQLRKNENPSELVLASIEQKSAQIKPISFKKAVSFNTNKKYLKYLSLPLIIWLLTVMFGSNTLFSSSFDRVVHYKREFLPPAPFTFNLKNSNLKVVEGEQLSILVEPVGEILPEQIYIKFSDQSYLLQKRSSTEFVYTIDAVSDSFDFHFESNGVRSKTYEVEVLETPNILDFVMEMDYPNYTRKKDEIIKNTGNATIPEGTRIIWKLNSKATEEIGFIESKERFIFTKFGQDFTFDKTVNKSFNYQITTSNNQLKDYEKLNYGLEVIKDALPEIAVKSDIDSVTRGDAQFVGQISDDYGISKLELWCKPEGEEDYRKFDMPITKDVFQDFYAIFPGDIELEAQTNYEILFAVYDNDAVNGRKVRKSSKFVYYQKSQKEITTEVLEEQKKYLNELNSKQKNTQDLKKSLDEMNRKLQTQDGMEWKDNQDLEKYIERQTAYQKMLERNTDKLLENLKELGPEENPNLENQRELLKDRLEEMKQLEEKQKLLEELKAMAEKLEKEGLLNQLEKLTELNKQQERSLERILEMTKQFYVEKKLNQIQIELNNLSEKQKKLSEEPEMNQQVEQEKLNESFKNLQKETDDLKKQNSSLKNPLSVPLESKEMDAVEDQMLKALEEIENSEGKGNSKSKQNQKNAAKQMKKMAEKLQQSMEMTSMERLDENIEDLERVLNNLLIFSLDQESLMLAINEDQDVTADFPTKLKKQQILKENFEHIDDSLYALSMRVHQISAKIEEDLSEAHYNLDKSLESLVENRVKIGRTHQQYTMTASNELADMLSEVLEGLKNSQNSQGSGKGKNGEAIALPDIIKKQDQLLQRMESEMEGKEGGERDPEKLSERQFEIYKELNQLKNQLERLIKENGLGDKELKAVKSDMEQLEQMLLERGLDKQSLQKMRQLNYNLLKLENAQLLQNQEPERKASSNYRTFPRENIRDIDSKRFLMENQDVLIRQNLPLSPFYQLKVQEYFKEN